MKKKLVWLYDNGSFYSKHYGSTYELRNVTDLSGFKDIEAIREWLPNFPKEGGKFIHIVDESYEKIVAINPDGFYYSGYTIGRGTNDPVPMFSAQCIEHAVDLSDTDTMKKFNKTTSDYPHEHEIIKYVVTKTVLPALV
jgi:hypothetical protein